MIKNRKLFFKLIFFIFLFQIKSNTKEILTFKEIEFSHLILDKEYEDLIEEFWKLITDNNKNCMVALNPENNKLIARGTEKQLNKLQKFIRKIDIHKQSVQINAIIIETKKNLDFGFGINWSGIYNRLSTIQDNNESFNFVGISSDIKDIPEPTQYINEQVPIAQQFGNLYVNPCTFAINLFPTSINLATANVSNELLCLTNPVNQTLNLPIVFGGPNLNLERLNAVLNGNDANSNIYLTSKPNMLTQDNTESNLLIGESLPYYYTTTELTPQNNVRFITSIYFRDIGVSLKARPRVLPNDKIELNIKTETVFRLSGSTKVDGGFATAIDPIKLETLNIEHKLIIDNESIILIGDFTRPTKKYSENKIPFIYKIPILKILFKGYKKSLEDVKNYIFIQARIIK